jgi:hypothetical protein
MYTLFLAAYLGLCAAVAFYAYRTGRRFITAFLVSLWASPLIGIISVIATRRRQLKK